MIPRIRRAPLMNCDEFAAYFLVITLYGCANYARYVSVIPKTRISDKQQLMLSVCGESREQMVAVLSDHVVGGLTCTYWTVDSECPALSTGMNAACTR